MIKTFSYRIKDSSCVDHFGSLAASVNTVWNFCNETQHAAVRWDRRWPSAFDLQKLTTGSSRLLGLHSQTIQAICRDFLHKLSTRLTKEFGRIFVGDVSAAKLAKTRMAKSVLNAGWSAFRTMLSYKAITRPAVFKIVNEKWTSAACAGCGALSGPRGQKELRIRHWVCLECGVVHDRDVNSAKLILLVGLGHQAPSVGISGL